VLVLDIFFMHRRRDSKGRFIASKFTENSRKPSHTNSANFYAGNILRGESSKEEIETTTKGPESKAIV
jgi:hypothetical protein